MSPQADFVVSNGTGAAVRSDINNQLAAIVSNSSGATEPATMYAYQFWADTTTGLLKLRNAANNAWITLRQLDGDFDTVPVENGTASAPSIYFRASGTDTGFYSSGTDALDFTTAGTRRLGISSSGDIIVYGGNTTLNDQGDLRFADSDSSNWVAFQGPATVSSNVTWTLPSADGTSGQVLITNGSGTLSWATASGTSDKISEGNTEAEVVDTGVDGHFKVTTEGTERLRVDSSGRALIGTSSAPTSGSYNQFGKLVVQGNTFSASTTSVLSLNRGEGAATIASSEELGVIVFGDSAGNEFGTIQCVADATAGAGDYPGRLVFSTTADGASSPTERMRIASGGDTGIFSDNDTLASRTSVGAGTTRSTFIGAHSATTSQNGTISCRIYSNGNIQNTNNSYGQLSDIKLKENITDANSQWSDLKAVRVRNFNFREGQTHRQIGVIAQELEEVSPGLVYESPDRDDDDNDLATVTKGVNYSVLYMKAVKALQEAMERIETLEAKVAALEAS
jgi:hypothetical protein